MPIEGEPNTIRNDFEMPPNNDITNKSITNQGITIKDNINIDELNPIEDSIKEIANDIITYAIKTIDSKEVISQNNINKPDRDEEIKDIAASLAVSPNRAFTNSNIDEQHRIDTTKAMEKEKENFIPVFEAVCENKEVNNLDSNLSRINLLKEGVMQIKLQNNKEYVHNKINYYLKRINKDTSEFAHINESKQQIEEYKAQLLQRTSDLQLISEKYKILECDFKFMQKINLELQNEKDKYEHYERSMDSMKRTLAGKDEECQSHEYRIKEILKENERLTDVIFEQSGIISDLHVQINNAKRIGNSNEQIPLNNYIPTKPITQKQNNISKKEDLINKPIDDDILFFESISSSHQG